MIFADATKVLDLIDDSMRLSASSRNVLNCGASWVDVSKSVGAEING